MLVKISGSSMRTRGYGLKDMEAFSSKLSGLADAIGVTGGWHEAPVPQITYQVPRGFYSCFSSCIKEHSGLPVICYNRINDRETAERILEEDKADLVACGRPSWRMRLCSENPGRTSLSSLCGMQPRMHGPHHPEPGSALYPEPGTGK